MARIKARLKISYARMYKGQSTYIKSYKQAKGRNTKS